MTCKCVRRTLEIGNYPQLQNLLPSAVDYVLCNFTNLNSEKCWFETQLRLPFKTKEEAKQWLSDFQATSFTTMRVDRTFPDVGRKLVYKTVFRCHHNTHPRWSRLGSRKNISKNTHCGATLTLAVKRTDHRCRSKDVHLPSHPTIVTIKFCHNHPISSEDILKHRDVAPELQEKFRNLFRAGYTPSTALKVHQYDLQINNIRSLLDRALCPDISWCFRQYYKEYGKRQHAEKRPQDLVSLLSEWNMNLRDDCVAVHTAGDSNWVVAICSPLMKRVHRLIPESAEIMFVDVSVGVETRWKQAKVYTFMTNSSAGCLPLGILLSTSENYELLENGLKLLRRLMPQDAFFGRGPTSGPKIILTDNVAPLQTVLKIVFEESRFHINPYSILASLWLWLQNAQNRIEKSDRPTLFHLCKCLVYSGSEEELCDAMFTIKQNELIQQKYSNLQQYINNIFNTRNMWCLKLITDVPTCSGIETSHLVENFSRMHKDKVFVKMKTFSIVQLTHFLLTRCDEYYAKRLVSLTQSNGNSELPCIFQIDFNGNDLFSIAQLSSEEYNVSNSSELNGDDNDENVVSASLWLCSCSLGSTGMLCKHQWAVLESMQWKPFRLSTVSEFDFDTRGRFHQLAYGSNTSISNTMNIAPVAAAIDNAQENFEKSINISDVNLQKIQDVMLSTDSSNSLTTVDAVLTNDYPWVEHVVDIEPDSGEVSNGIIASNPGIVEDKLDVILQNLRTRLSERPEEFSLPIATFIKNWDMLKTDDELISALNNFGKPPKPCDDRNDLLEHEQLISVEIPVISPSILKQPMDTSMDQKLSITLPLLTAVDESNDSDNTLSMQDDSVPSVHMIILPVAANSLNPLRKISPRVMKVQLAMSHQ